MTLTQTKTEFLTESLIEQVNDRWKVNSIESGRSFYSRLSYKVAKKYIKVLQGRVNSDGSYETEGVFMFIDKETEACYKPASYKAPAKGIRFFIESLAQYPGLVDPYGSFLYVR